MNKLLSGALALATMATLGGSAMAATAAPIGISIGSACPNLTPDATKTLEWNAVKKSFLGQDFGAGLKAIFGITVDCQHASADVNGILAVTLAGVELRAFDVHPQLAVDSSNRVTASVQFVTFGQVIDTFPIVSSSPHALDFSHTYSVAPIPPSSASKTFSAMKTYSLPVVGSVALSTDARYNVSALGNMYVEVNANGPQMNVVLVGSLDVAGDASARASGTVQVLNTSYTVSGSGSASLDIIHLPYTGLVIRLGGHAAGYIAEASFLKILRQHLLEADLSARFSISAAGNEVASKTVSVFHMDDQSDNVPALDWSYSKNLGSAPPF